MPNVPMELPDGWTATTLGEITEERGKRVGRGSQIRVLSSTKHHGLVLSDEYFKGRTIYSDDTSLYKQVNLNWFAYATNHLAEGSIGLQDKLDVGCVSPVYTVFSCREGVDPRFLFRLLKSPAVVAAYRAHEQASVDRRGAVRYKDFSKIVVKLPTIEVQRQIATVLDSVDELRRAAKDRIEKLSAAARAALWVRFQEVAASNPLVPWRSLESVGKICSGSTPPRAYYSRYYADGTIPWLKTMDLNEGVIYATHERITDAAVVHCSCPMLPPGAVLIAMYGGWAQIGRTAVLGSAASINQAISAVEVQDPDVDPLYLQLALQILRGKWKQIAASTRKDPNITRADVLSFEIPVPARDEQVKLVAASELVKSYAGSERMYLSKLQLLAWSLVADLLAGRTRTATERV